MGGCTNCASKGACSTRKGDERELLGRLLPELYPALRWGEVADAARDGVGEKEGRRLARQAAALLQAPTYFRPGDEDEPCDHIWVLCVGRQPGLVEVDAGTADVPDDLVPGVPIREKYLRASLSNLARVATLQEVTIELAQEGGPGPDGDLRLTTLPMPGVYDPILLKRTRKLVELLVAAEISYLDFGVIEAPPPGFQAPDYEAAFGQAPGAVNYLFYPQPSRCESTRYLPRGGS